MLKGAFADRRRVAYLCGLSLVLAVWGYFNAIAVTGSYATIVFQSYWASGHALASGGNPYAWLPQTYSAYSSGKLVADLNLNVPLFLPFTQLFAVFPLVAAARAWAVASAIAMLAAILFVAERSKASGWHVAWAFFAPAAPHSIMIGQNYAILVVLGATIWWGLQSGRERAAAIALGLLIAFKPNFGLAAVALFAAGHRTMAIRSLAVAALASLLPMLLYGPGIYLQWLAALHDDFHWQMTDAASIASQFHRLGLPVVGLCIAVATGLLGLAAIAIRNLPVERALVAGMALGIFCAPLAWFDYVLAIVPLLVAMRWSRLTAAGCLMLLAWPMTVHGLSMLQPAGMLAFGGWYPLAILLIGLGAVFGEPHDEQAGAAFPLPA